MLDDLALIPFLHTLSAEQLSLLSPHCSVLNCPPDTVIFEQGGAATHLYLISHGVVTIHFKPYDGPTMILTRLHEGDIMGWSSVVGNPAYTSGATSETAVEALCIEGRDLRRLCAQHPATGRLILDGLATMVSERWENSHAQIQALLNESLGKAE